MWLRGTGAMPWRRASLQVIRPFPLSSYGGRTSDVAAGAFRGDLSGRLSGCARANSKAVGAQPERTRWTARTSRRSTVSAHLRLFGTDRTIAFESAEDFAEHLLRFIGSYNERRLQTALQYLCPHRFEEDQARIPVISAA